MALVQILYFHLLPQKVVGLAQQALHNVKDKLAALEAAHLMAAAVAHIQVDLVLRGKEIAAAAFIIVQTQAVGVAAQVALEVLLLRVVAVFMVVVAV